MSEDSQKPLDNDDPVALRIALRNSEQSYHSLFQTTPLPVWVRDIESLRFLEVNAAACQAYGYSREEFLTLTAYDIRPPWEKQRFHDLIFTQTPSDNGAYTGEWLHMRKDGSVFRAEIWSHNLVFKGRPARLVIARDMTAQLKAEAETRFNARRFQLIASATSDAIWDWDYTTDTLWWGDSFFTLFGYKRDDFFNALDAWAEAVHPEDRQRVSESLQRARTEGHQRWHEEYRFRRRDGTYAIVLDRGIAVRDDQGRVERMVGGMTDITEQTRLQKQHLGAQRLESIGTLAGGIAHDLNNTLSPIVLAADMLRLGDLNEEQRSFVEIIENNARRSADLVRQVLTFARGIKGHHVPTQALPIILETAAYTRDTFPPTIQVCTDLPSKLWTIHADTTQLNQVLLNLSLNARDAMPEGGRLTFEASDLLLDPLQAAAQPGARPGPYISITVSDTGTGIAPEHLGRIFDPFFTTKEVGKGTGLGLSTVHAIIREHGGFITVDSTRGMGSIFRVHLPASPQKDHPADTPPSPATSRSSGDGQTILVVDDQPSLRNIISLVLRQHGYHPILAADGAEGVALYAQNRERISLVITDMAMPVMDGAATIAALLRINPLVPIIAMSGHDPDGRLAKNIKTSVFRFLAKPFDPDQLFTAVREALQLAKKTFP